MTSRSQLRTKAVGFTLIELMVVTALMSVAVAVAAIRAGSVTTRGRLHSAASQICSITRLAATRARLEGAPRLIEYGRDGELLVRAPKASTGSWQWDEGRRYSVGRGVHFERLLAEGQDSPSDPLVLRIGSDGRYFAHGLVLQVAGQHAALVVEPAGNPEFLMIDKILQAQTFCHMKLKLEPYRERQERTHAD